MHQNLHSYHNEKKKSPASQQITIFVLDFGQRPKVQFSEAPLLHSIWSQDLCLLRLLKILMLIQSFFLLLMLEALGLTVD